MAGAPTFLTREPEAAALIGAVKAGATHAFFVPPVITRFLDAGDAAINAISGLRYLVYGAAPMPLPLLQSALEAWPQMNFIQVYGQTELCGGITALDADDHRDSDRQHLLLSAGKAFPATKFELSTRKRVSSCPPASPARSGTEQSAHDRLPEPGRRPPSDTITADDWLRTGDIGRLDADGYLYIEDRLKDMIITGGENVYGPEVESVLIEHPAIADAAIIGVPDDFWGESVKAIVVATAETEPDEIIEFCRAHLAGYKCPRTVDFVKRCPATRAARSSKPSCGNRIGRTARAKSEPRRYSPNWSSMMPSQI